MRESDESDSSQEHGIAGAADLNANVKLHEVKLIPIDRVGEAAVIHIWRVDVRLELSTKRRRVGERLAVRLTNRIICRCATLTQYFLCLTVSHSTLKAL